MNTTSVTNSNTQFVGKNISVFASLDSTNNYAKKHAHILADGHVIVATEQPGGRGRQGKSFYSPENGGLYMSVIVKNEKAVQDPLFTVKSCIAVCNAIDRLCTNDRISVGIKWVNDIYFSGKKLCGILCEKFTDKNGFQCIVAGFGVNFKFDASSLPAELRKIVTSIYDMTKKCHDTSVLCAYICEEFEKLIYESEYSDERVLEEYKKRSVVIGKEISIITDKGEPVRAAALDICPDGALLVRTQDGFTQKLCSGEITIRLKNKFIV